VVAYAGLGNGVATFFALNVAYAVASGGEFLCWQVLKVLYIDSKQYARRLLNYCHAPSRSQRGCITRLPVFMPDLATIEGQQAIEPFLEGVKLIVIDNISTLCRSGRENESEGWITVQEWALRQRSAGRSVLFVHHAGKGGNQRGTSKREDVLDTVINLKRPIDYNPSEGASFEVHFEKTRGFSGEDAEPLSCRLGYDQHNNPAWLYSRLEDSTFDKVVTLINEGLTQAEIVIELDINKSNISRHVKKARLQGLIQEPKTKSKPVNSANYSRARDGE
jgi:putative DNA primase/helicase